MIASAACGKQAEEPVRDGQPAKETTGHFVTHLSVGVGGTWNSGYSVDVVPENYAVVEHPSCPNAKDLRYRDKGICVVRITKEQSDKFVAAMERFKKNATPLQKYSFDDPHVRPDNKPCKNLATDATSIWLQWIGTEGARYAHFYLGCDYEEFGDFYNSALSVTDALPIQGIIKER